MKKNAKLFTNMDKNMNILMLGIFIPNTKIFI